jgi:hypothetical protein
MREGVDERGTRKVGLATRMKAGAGSGKQLGTGLSRTLGGDSDQTGLEVVNQEIVDYALPTHKVAGVGDFRALTLVSKVQGVDKEGKPAVDKEGKPIRVKRSRVREEAKGLISAAYTSMNPDDFIGREGKAKMKGMIGAIAYGGQFVGKDGKPQSEIWDQENQKLGLWDEALGEYRAVDKSFQDEWKPVFSEWKRAMKISGAGSPDTIRTLNRWRRLYQSWDIVGKDDKSPADMSQEELEAIAVKSGLMAKE